MKKVFNWIDKKLDVFIDACIFYLETWKWQRVHRNKPLLVGMEEQEDLTCEICGEVMWIDHKKDGYQRGYCLICEEW